MYLFGIFSFYIYFIQLLRKIHATVSLKFFRKTKNDPNFLHKKCKFENVEVLILK